MLSLNFSSQSRIQEHRLSAARFTEGRFTGIWAMHLLKRFTVAALMGVGVLAINANIASARVVCNDDGDCWHSSKVYEYPAGVDVTVHDSDDWKWKEGEKLRWHEHEGRGYWHGGTWVEF